MPQRFTIFRIKYVPENFEILRKTCDVSKHETKLYEDADYFLRFHNFQYLRVNNERDDYYLR